MLFICLINVKNWMFQSLADDFKAKFDSFDGANDEAARGFLNKSISDELRKTMRFIAPLRIDSD